MVRPARARARVPRQIDRPVKLVVAIDDQRIPITLSRAKPRDAGVGDAEGSGVDAEVTFDADDGLRDDEIVARGEDFLIRATNHALLVVAFEGANQKRVEQLTPVQFENRSIDVDDSGAWRALTLPAPTRPGPIRLRTNFDDGAAQRRLDGWSAEFEPCGRLWRDVLVSFYEGRYPEVLLFARALVELTWSTAIARVLAAVDAGTFNGDVRTARALRRQASEDRMGLAERIVTHAPAYFGFSFADEFDAAVWDRFVTFLNQRNTVAHGAGAVTPDDAWRALQASSSVAEKILSVANGLPPAAPPT